MEIKLLLMMLTICNFCQSQDIKNKSWEYQKIYALNEGKDSTILYSKKMNIRKINIGSNYKIIFNSDNSYSTLYNNSTEQKGIYKQESNYLMIDNDTLEVLNITSLSLILKGRFLYFNEVGDFKAGVVIIEYSNAVEFVETIKSGYWQDYSTWSSGRIPNKSDMVIIKQNHIVELKPNEVGFCKNILIEKGAAINYKANTSLKINSSD